MSSFTEMLAKYGLDPEIFGYGADPGFPDQQQAAQAVPVVAHAHGDEIPAAPVDGPGTTTLTDLADLDDPTRPPAPEREYPNCPPGTSPPPFSSAKASWLTPVPVEVAPEAGPEAIDPPDLQAQDHFELPPPPEREYPGCPPGTTPPPFGPGATGMSTPVPVEIAPEAGPEISALPALDDPFDVDWTPPPGLSFSDLASWDCPPPSTPGETSMSEPILMEIDPRTGRLVPITEIEPYDEDEVEEPYDYSWEDIDDPFV